MWNIWAISILLCGTHLTISDSESIRLGSLRSYEKITQQNEKQVIDHSRRIKQQKMQAIEFPFLISTITKPKIVEYNLTKNYVIGSWPTINAPDKDIFEPMPTPMAFQHPAHGSYQLPVTVPGQHFLATTNDDQAAGAWTRALPISSILSQEKRQIQRKPGEELGLPVRSSPEVQIAQKSDTVRLPKMLAEHNLTLNPFYIDEEYFDKEKREYLYALGPEVQHVSISKYVNVSLGRTARLKCFTYNVPNVSVSWIRHNDVNILSLNQLLYTKDTRVSVMVTPDMDEWELQIRDVKKEDEGQYECQVNTNPLSQLLASLSVTKSYAEIPGDQELFMAEKSFLNLTCLIHSVETPEGVFWRHKEKLLSTSASESITVSPFIRTSASTFSTSLSVWLTSPDQSGHYHCIPTNTEKATVMLHVLDGDMLRAMYSNCSRSLHQSFPSLLSSFTIHLLQVLLFVRYSIHC